MVTSAEDKQISVWINCPSFATSSHFICRPQQEKTTNCGTKAADVLDKIFLKSAHIMRIYRIFWCFRNCNDFASHINSKCCSIYSRLVVIFRRSFVIPNFREVESPPTASQYISLQSFALSAAVLARIPISNNGPQIWAGGSKGSKMVPIEMSSPHAYSTSMHTLGLFWTVWPQYITRQTYTQHYKTRN